MALLGRREFGLVLSLILGLCTAGCHPFLRPRVPADPLPAAAPPLQQGTDTSRYCQVHRPEVAATGRTAATLAAPARINPAVDLLPPLPRRVQRTSSGRTSIVAASHRDGKEEDETTKLPAPKEREEDKANQDKAEPIDLNLDESDVRKALELVSRQGKLNLLISPGVVGRVTANVKGLGPEEALHAIVKLANLQLRREGHLIFIYSPDEISRGIGLEGLFITRVYRLNYVRSNDVITMIRPLLSARGRATATPASQVGLRSSVESGGGLTAPTAGGAAGGGGTGGGGGGGGGGAGQAGGGASGGNSLAGNDVVVVQDQESIIRQIDYVVNQIDVPPLQVEIEAVLVSVTHDSSNEFGIDWAILDAGGQVLGVFGNGTTINAAVGFRPQKTVINGLLRGTPARGFAADQQGTRFGFTDSSTTGFIRALEKLGKVDVLASPRLLVLNKQSASLLLGQRLGYSVASQSLVSTVQQIQFLNVGTQLYVRPFISCDGNIRMEVHPERSSGRIVDGIPQEDTTEVTTNVMIPDGGTLVLAGLIDQQEDRRQNGTPILQDIPFLGTLFRERFRTANRKELVVILKPRILMPFEGGAPRCVCPPHPHEAPAFLPPPGGPSQSSGAAIPLAPPALPAPIPDITTPNIPAALTNLASRPASKPVSAPNRMR